jgi:hypothetical protein
MNSLQLVSYLDKLSTMTNFILRESHIQQKSEDYLQWLNHYKEDLF